MSNITSKQDRPLKCIQINIQTTYGLNVVLNDEPTLTPKFQHYAQRR